MSNQSVLIRRGTPEDLPATLTLIKELALFERAPQEVENTVERMQEDGFGPNPVFGFHVAELDGSIVGIAVYYYRYSTWKGKRLYLEDIIVTEALRGKGIGKLLFEASVGEAHRTGCNGMSWQVLEWNTPAIEFYKKFGAQLDGEWINCSLTGAQVAAYSKLLNS